MAKTKEDRSRNLKLLLYPDNSSHVAALDKIQHDSQYACHIGIRHVSIEGSKEHWHIYLCFDNPRFVRAVAADLGLVSDLGEPDTQFVRTISGRLDNALVYLTHCNCPEKEQYSFEDLFGAVDLIERTKKACLKYQRKEMDMSDAIVGCLDYIRRYDGVLSMTNFGYWVCSSPYFRAASSGIVRAAIEEHNRQLFDIARKEWLMRIENSNERYQAMLENPELMFSEWEGDLPL